MVFPLIGKAAGIIARNKKAREALTKPVGQFLSRRSKIATATEELKKEGLKAARQAKKSSPSVKALTGFPGGLGIGAGTATVMTDKKSQKPKKVTGKPDVYGGTSKKRKIKPKKFIRR